jgi:hypothetical protein
MRMLSAACSLALLASAAPAQATIEPDGGLRVLSAGAVMFPVAFTPGSIAAREPQADDIAGISDLYPGRSFSSEGSLSGRVTRAGQPVFGAHVVAFDPSADTMVGGFTLTAQGGFSILGLSPGPHVVRVEQMSPWTRISLMVAGGVTTVLVDLAPARAQSELLPGRIEIGFGVLSSGRTALGSMAATETTAAGGHSPIFATSTALTGATSLTGRVAVGLSRSVGAEASAGYGTPALRTTISNDIEAGGPVTATETIKRYMVGGAALWYLPSHWMPAPFSPFLAGGAAYRRQLHESETLGASGGTLEAGGSVKYLLASRPDSQPKSPGLRADVRLIASWKGVAFDDRLRLSPAFGGSIFARF